MHDDEDSESISSDDDISSYASSGSDTNTDEDEWWNTLVVHVLLILHAVKFSPSFWRFIFPTRVMTSVNLASNPVSLSVLYVQ